MTVAGTRNPRSSTSTCPSGLPRWRSEDVHESVAHGVVPWAMSPSTVADPVEHRRPTARSCIGERSCASSSTTWPRLGVRSRWSRTSSSSTASARRPPGAATGPAGGDRPQQPALLVLVEQTVGGAGERGGVGEQLEQHGAGVQRRPHRRGVPAHHGRPRRPCPAPGRRGSRRPAPSAAAPRGRAGAAASAARRRTGRRASGARPGSPAPRTPGRATCAPRGARRGPRSASRTCDHTARRSTSARRASPLSTAVSMLSTPRTGHRRDAGPRWSCGRPRPRPAPAAPRRCGRGRRGSGR